MFFEVEHKGTKKKMIVNVEKIDFVTEYQENGRGKSNAIIQINGCPYEVEQTYEKVIKLVERCLTE